MKRPTFLIVNADDFGLTKGVNRGIIQSHEEGIVTSASLMVRHEAAREASEYARSHPRLDVGLHVDLGEWVFQSGRWLPVYEVVPLGDPTAVREEVARQFESFHDLMETAPTHLDSHQHVHRKEPVRSVLQDLAGELGISLRHFSPYVQYCGAFYGQTAEGEPLPDGIEWEGLTKILAGLPDGVTELACHPGYPEDLDTAYAGERVHEIGALCDDRIRQVITEKEIQLISFAQVPEHLSEEN